MENDAQRILDHDADDKFLRECGIARYDNERDIANNLDRAAQLRKQIDEFVKITLDKR